MEHDLLDTEQRGHFGTRPLRKEDSILAVRGAEREGVVASVGVEIDGERVVGTRDPVTGSTLPAVELQVIGAAAKGNAALVDPHTHIRGGIVVLVAVDHVVREPAILRARRGRHLPSRQHGRLRDRKSAVRVSDSSGPTEAQPSIPHVVSRRSCQNTRSHWTLIIPVSRRTLGKNGIVYVSSPIDSVGRGGVADTRVIGSIDARVPHLVVRTVDQHTWRCNTIGVPFAWSTDIKYWIAAVFRPSDSVGRGGIPNPEESVRTLTGIPCVIDAAKIANGRVRCRISIPLTWGTRSENGVPRMSRPGHAVCGYGIAYLGIHGDVHSRVPHLVAGDVWQDPGCQSTNLFPASWGANVHDGV